MIEYKTIKCSPDLESRFVTQLNSFGWKYENSREIGNQGYQQYYVSTKESSVNPQNSGGGLRNYVVITLSRDTKDIHLPQLQVLEKEWEINFAIWTQELPFYIAGNRMHGIMLMFFGIFLLLTFLFVGIAFGFEGLIGMEIFFLILGLALTIFPIIWLVKEKKRAEEHIKTCTKIKDAQQKALCEMDELAAKGRAILDAETDE